jgi:PPOX class probable F420-dependent enzyme
MPNLAQFKNQKYLNLETFKKNGQGVKTPVWFLEDDEILYIRTLDDSWKVKRIRNNSSVRVAPSDGQGKVLGEWVEAQASIAPNNIHEQIDIKITQKYGLAKRVFDFLGWIQRKKYTLIKVILK